MNKRKEFVAVLAATTVIAGGVISLSAVSMQAEAERRQKIYSEAVAERDLREADRLKAEEPYRLEAEREVALVEQARADAEAKKKKADEAFANAIREHPVPKAFMGTEASEDISEVSEESNLLNCAYEYELEQKLKEEETSVEESSNEEASEEESSDEESSEEEYPEEEISEEEASDENEVASTAALLLTPEEEDFCLRVFYAETGDYNSDKFLKANAWLLRNGIEEYGFWNALTPAHYQVVCTDGLIRGAEGVVTSDMAHENERITSIFYGVMSGDIESPIANYTCGLPYDVWGYENGYDFAVDYGIAEFSVVDNGVYFPAECWTEALTELLMNT